MSFGCKRHCCYSVHVYVWSVRRQCPYTIASVSRVCQMTIGFVVRHSAPRRLRGTVMATGSHNLTTDGPRRPGVRVSCNPPVPVARHSFLLRRPLRTLMTVVGHNATCGGPLVPFQRTPTRR